VRLLPFPAAVRCLDRVFVGRHSLTAIYLLQASASLSFAVALAASGKYQAAHDAFATAASASRHATEVYVYPHTPRPHHHLSCSYDEWSNMLFNAGQREAAAQVLKQGARHNPRWFGGRLGAAIVLRDMGHTLDAIQLCVPPLCATPTATIHATFFATPQIQRSTPARTVKCSRLLQFRKFVPRLRRSRARPASVRLPWHVMTSYT
jgi:hypothetical protein